MGNDEVLTAGGAANPQSGKKKNRNRNRKKNKKNTPVKANAPPSNPTNASDVTNADPITKDAFAAPISPIRNEGKNGEIEASEGAFFNSMGQPSTPSSLSGGSMDLELEASEKDHIDLLLQPNPSLETEERWNERGEETDHSEGKDSLNHRKAVDTVQIEDLYKQAPQQPEESKTNDLVWLVLCSLGILASFVCYGLLLEYTTSGGRKLHELSFLFVTSGLYTLTAAAGRHVRAETPSTIPPARFAILGLTSMGSTFCSVRSLRYVIYPIQVLAKSCKPVPVMLMGAMMGKKYDTRKYINVLMIVTGVALFMGGGSSNKSDKKVEEHEEQSTSSQAFGIILLFISLCFDGGTGAYEDKLMSVHSVQPFDLMYNIQLGKTILAGISLLVLNQLHIFFQMCQEMGFLLVALGLSGALGQVFIFVTIAKFGALTCSIIGLGRKVTTLVASIYIYGHVLNGVQFTGLVVAVMAMVLNFTGKNKKSGHGHHGDEPRSDALTEEMQKMLDDDLEDGDVELPSRK
ncbi:unnamed protein product [Cylindrotheca closterium]|uniref:Uncharacterized protein n=1 Tax=Cylindrotheca closterium TaxID=2856 RepID=A0AAD2JNI4_9STRA|nr:unnamed protein product [Cylindrotheca closterium]